MIPIALGVALLLAACNAAPAPKSPAQGAAAREQASVDALHLKTRFKDVVMGTEVNGATLVLYADENNLESMDVPVEDAMIGQTLGHWKRIWLAAHPGRHATLRVSVRDYYGKELTGNSAKV